MEYTAEISFCSRCRFTKPVNEFMGFGAKGTSKQFRTCNKNTNKRRVETEENEEMEQENEEFLEIIDPDSFCNYIAQLLQHLSTQLENDTENTPPFHFQCEIVISSFNKLAKE